MSKIITISIADKVEKEIKEEFEKTEGNNFSEFAEELLRIGLYYHQKEKEVDTDGNR